MLTADTRSRDPKEPDGSAATLWGKINPKSFGDRVQYSKPGSEGDAKRCACHAAAARTRAVARATAALHAVLCARGPATRAPRLAPAHAARNPNPQAALACGARCLTPCGWTGPAFDRSLC